MWQTEKQFISLDIFARRCRVIPLDICQRIWDDYVQYLFEQEIQNMPPDAWGDIFRINPDYDPPDITPFP